MTVAPTVEATEHQADQQTETDQRGGCSQHCQLAWCSHVNNMLDQKPGGDVPKAKPGLR